MQIQISDQVKKAVVTIARILLGCVFVFSGYVKAVDPFGSTYKIEDYLTAMGLEFFAPFAFVAAVLLAAYEFLVGVCLLLGANIKTTTILALLMMAFMTPLTLWIAVADPVTDCGCFGDALVISNWATFWKNVVIVALLLLVWWWKEHSPKLFSQRTEWIIAIAAGFYSIGVSIYCYFNLPIIDFRPYKNGTKIEEAMRMPGSDEDVEYVAMKLDSLSTGAITKEKCVEALCQPQFHLDPSTVEQKVNEFLSANEKDPEESADKLFQTIMSEYETLLVYEKDGVQQEFTLQNYPKDDSWKFVDQKSKQIKEGYEPPIHDFALEDPDNGDITEEVLKDSSYTFFLVSYYVDKAVTNKRKEINDIYEYAKKNGYRFIGLTTTGLSTKEMQEFKIEMGGIKFPFVNTDEKQLKTMVRSNPGLVLIKDGVVINKWSNKNMPTFTEPLEGSSRGQVQQANDRRVVFLSTLLFLAALLGVFAFDKVVGAIASKLKKEKD